MMRYLLCKQLKSEKDSEVRRGASQMVAKDTQNMCVKSKYFQNCTAKKPKRFRSAFTTDQIDYLEREFRKFPYIGSGNRKEIANKLNIPERAVKIWFQNRRMKEKKESVTKLFDIETLSKDAIKFTNEPLNNWQSNNDRRYTPFEQKKASDINNLVKPNVQGTPANKEQVCSSNINEVTKNFRKATYAVTKNAINVDAAPVTCQKIKGKPNGAPVALSKQKNIVPSKNQNLDPASTSNCPLDKSYLNINQDTPQDLSSRSVINNLYSQQPHHYPVNYIPGAGFVPLHMQSPYPSSVLQSGNVIWKPVNMVSTLPVPQSSAVSIGIPQNSTRVHLVHNRDKNICNCNCHGSLVQCFNQVNARPHPQYIVAIPLINPPK